MLSETQYVKSSGLKCPRCESENIDPVDYFESDRTINDCILQNILCLDCNAEWFDVYKLDGYSIINMPAFKEDCDEED